MTLLSDAERERGRRFVFVADRRDYAAAHALVRRMLSSGEDVPPAAWTFGETPRGKPFLKAGLSDTRLEFNLSHTRGLVACAMARGADVGIDVESVDRASAAREISLRYFTPSEIGWLDAAPDDEHRARFIELWALKESYLKATGAGLTDALDSFSFSLDAPGVIRFQPPVHDAGGYWAFALFAPTASTRLALGLRADRPIRWRFDLQPALEPLRTTPVEPD